MRSLGSCGCGCGRGSPVDIERLPLGPQDGRPPHRRRRRVQGGPRRRPGPARAPGCAGGFASTCCPWTISASSPSTPLTRVHLRADRRAPRPFGQVTTRTAVQVKSWASWPTPPSPSPRSTGAVVVGLGAGPHLARAAGSARAHARDTPGPLGPPFRVGHRCAPRRAGRWCHLAKCPPTAGSRDVGVSPGHRLSGVRRPSATPGR